MNAQTPLRIAASLLLVVTTSPMRAQSAPDRASVFGTVRDTNGIPISLARLSTSGLMSISDSAGHFSLAGLPGGRSTLRVRRLGFAPLDLNLDLVAGRIDSLTVVLAVLPVSLPEVTAAMDGLTQVRLASFYRHRHTGIGTFLDRSEIEAKQLSRLSDILRRLPGMRVQSDRNGRSQLRTGRMMGGRDCPPDMWVDGVRASGMAVDDLPLTDVEALEIYSGPAGIPPEMNSRLGSPACGAIVIWTRVPGAG